MGARTQAGGGRIALFDNLKGMLIILVVVGHVMHPVHSENPALSTLFDLIYLFHMPLFVLLSGLFAKGAWRPAADGGHGRLNVNRIISFVVLGLAYQVALLAINGVLLEQPGRILLFSSAPWYLIAMAWWYLMTPALAKLGPARGMAVALAASLAWGCVDMSRGFLALSRTFAFLPCFALGYYLTTERLMRLRQRPILWLAVAAAALIMLARIVDEHAYDAFFPLVYGDNPLRRPRAPHHRRDHAGRPCRAPLGRDAEAPYARARRGVLARRAQAGAETPLLAHHPGRAHAPGLRAPSHHPRLAHLPHAVLQLAAPP